MHMCMAAIYSELRWDGGEELAELLFILNSGGMVGIINSSDDSGATRCRAAVYSELWRDGGE